MTCFTSTTDGVLPLYYIPLVTVAFAVAASAGCDHHTTSPTPGVKTAEAYASRRLDHDSIQAWIESDEGSKQDYWFAHYAQGAKIGYRRLTVMPVDDRQTLMAAIDRMQFRRFGQPVRQILLTANITDFEGHLLEFYYELQSEDSTESFHGQRVGDRMLCTTTQKQTSAAASTPTPRKSQTRSIAWPAGTLGPLGIEAYLLDAEQWSEGSTELSMFVPVMDRIGTYVLSHGSRDVSESVSGDTSGRIEVRPKQAPDWEPPTVYWLDESGRISKIQEPFFQRDTLAVDRSEALRLDALAELDLGIDLAIPFQPGESNPHDTQKAVYRITLPPKVPVEFFPDDPSQSVQRDTTDQATAMLDVRRIRPDDPAELRIVPDSPTDEDLAANRYIQSDDRRVLAIARSATSSDGDPWRIAKGLEQYLYRILDKSDFSQSFSSAAEVAVRRGGDCSEHAVLLAATCRAMKIPARVVVGLVYSEENQSFLYHMWNEVWIDDRWIGLDATLGKGGVGVGHIKLRHSNLARQSPYQVVIPLLPVVGKMQIEAVDVP